jgi:transcriptional regulator
MSKKSKLTQRQREQIVEMYKSGMTQKAIAEKMGCTIPNVSYLVKKDREKQKKNARNPTANGIPKQYPTDPIAFRIGKIIEVESDIQYARDEKVIHTLGSLHKLHLSLHDELRTFVEAQKENYGTNADELRIQIVDAIQALPPILKKQVMEELLADTSNIVRFKTS